MHFHETCYMHYYKNMTPSWSRTCLVYSFVLAKSYLSVAGIIHDDLILNSFSEIEFWAEVQL